MVTAVMIFTFAACKRIEVPDNIVETSVTETETVSSEPVTVTETESDTTGTESETTAEALTETTQPVTSTTLKKVVTTAAEKTTKLVYEGTTRHVRATKEVEMKYSIIRYEAYDKVYAVGDDGSEKYIGNDNVTKSYNRFYYLADYDDLLPAAKNNRQKYSEEINSVLSLTNKMRAEKGLKPLKLSEKLTEQACVRAEEVAWSGKYSHLRPNGRLFRSIFTENGYENGTAGENLGWNYDAPSKVCTAWRNSESHYENIMNPDFEYIGIGVAANCDEDLALVWVQHFYCE